MVANYRERLDGWTTSLDVIVEGLPGRPLENGGRTEVTIYNNWLRGKKTGLKRS